MGGSEKIVKHKDVIKTRCVLTSLRKKGRFTDQTLVDSGFLADNHRQGGQPPAPDQDESTNPRFILAGLGRLG